ALFGALPRWTIRLLVASHLDDAIDLYEAAWREEFASPLRLSTADELRWYFGQRRQLEERSGGTDGLDQARYVRSRDAFGEPLRATDQGDEPLGRQEGVPRR